MTRFIVGDERIGHRLDVPEALGDLQAGHRLPRRAERGAVPLDAHPAEGPAALGELSTTLLAARFS